MPAGTGTKLVHRQHFVNALASTTPSSTTPPYVSLKGWNHLTVLITAKNGTTVTGSAIALKQATAVAGTGEKALGFDAVFANLDAAAGDALTPTAVPSDTFTTDATDSKVLVYLIEVDADALDRSGGFDCVRVGTGNATSTTLNVTYILSGQRYASPTLPVSGAVAD
jgi:hypothetical protein